MTFITGSYTPTGQRKYMIERLVGAVHEMATSPPGTAKHELAIAQYLCAADWLERNGLARLQILLLSGINPSDYTIEGSSPCAAATSTPQ